MIRIPYEIELYIYRMVHEMYMTDVQKELKNDLLNMNETLVYFQRRAFYPYLLWNRLSTFRNVYCKQKIDRYVHYKKYKKCLSQLIKPKQHIIYT